MASYLLIVLKRPGLMGLIGLFLSGCATHTTQQNLVSRQPNELSYASSANQINDLLIVDCAVPIADSDFKPMRSTAKACRNRNGIFSLDGSRDENIKIWEKKAQQGDPIAQNYIGEIYEKGTDQAPDYSRAQKWYRMAAEQGFQRAQTNLAFLYQNGLGVEKDPQKALNWYKKAAEFDTTENLAVQNNVELSRLRQTIDYKSLQLKKMRQELKNTLQRLNIAMQALRSIQGVPLQVVAENKIHSESLQEHP